MGTTGQSLHGVHQGRNLQRLRKTRNVKQVALSEASGIPQQTLSRYEKMATIPDEAIEKLAAALKVPSEFIRDMEDSDNVTVNVQNNTVDNKESVSHIGYENESQSQNTFNPIEKIIRLSEEKNALYERMLKSAEDKIGSLEKRLELLERLVEKKH